MVLSRWIEPHRCWQLVSGIAGIYLFYLFAGLVHQHILKQEYKHDSTGQSSIFPHPSASVILPSLIAAFIGAIINRIRIPSSERIHIPHLKSIPCAAMVVTSSLTYSYAVMLTNYPVVLMFKSCNLVSVLLVGILCSRVRDKSLQIRKRKLLVGLAITIGIVMFKVFDPNGVKGNERSTELAGILLLIISLFADGFLPDFQAEIKSVLKPSPMEMMVSINLWVGILSFLYSLIIMEVGPMVTYMWNHWLVVFHITLMGVVATVGQIFVYRMIKQFKQHFVPFVVTTRKIFSVGLSIIWYSHQTSAGQIIGILIVLILVSYEFISQLVEEKQLQTLKNSIPNDDINQNGPYADDIGDSGSQIQPEAVLPSIESNNIVNKPVEVHSQEEQ